ncbi:hypothetical protein BJ322DRAFT_494099 [Thelephora terrestris]|uniref:Uncharacterized protein n=1 Tax=Thelephora terrestris TaxID=56493 RepID=A0A9P6H2Y4_9AGAM|nr:hypothetical protein BJ322DRAFT_494099 [Thelephora terrestris]
MPKVLHASMVKVHRREIPWETRTPRVTVKATPLRLRLARKKMAKYGRFFFRDHILRELRFHILPLNQLMNVRDFFSCRWRSLFFYLFTGQTSFAPLRSQRTDSCQEYTSSPPPCSPKSIYIIANLLDMQPLRDLALKDIESKLSEDNIVEEFFSCVSAGEQQIIEMECRLLFSKFKNEATTSRMQEKISSIPGNHLAHCAGALKLGLRAALDLKKQEPQAGITDPRAGAEKGAKLRCWSTSCPGHREHMPYSLVGSLLHCPRCNYSIMECVGCENLRGGVYDRCKSCHKKFL